MEKNKWSYTKNVHFIHFCKFFFCKIFKLRFLLKFQRTPYQKMTFLLASIIKPFLQTYFYKPFFKKRQIFFAFSNNTTLPAPDM